MKTIYLVLVFFLLSTFLYSTIINVPADQPTIQEGIDVAIDADTVLVQPGTYVENINYNGKLITIGSLFLTTQDTTYISQTIIDGDGLDTVVKFESGENSSTLLTGFTIANGHASEGGGISCHEYSSPSLANVSISDNFAYYGGGIYCGEMCDLSLEDVTISGNAAGAGGGIFCINSSPNLQNVTITGNDSGEVGQGSGIYCSNSSPSLENVTISGNSGYFGGGGIYCVDNSSPSMENVTISDNGGEAAYSDGGIYCDNSSPSLVNVTIFGNMGSGILCFNNSSPSLVNVTISGNTAGGMDAAGGGIKCYNSSPSLANVTISDNTAYQGGGISCDNSNLILENVTISGNSAYEIGGGIYYNNSSPSLVNVIISGNSAAFGGGIYCAAGSSPSLMNVTITGNSAVASGGGIFCADWGTSPSLVNVTIIGNSAGTGGGGITCGEASSMNLVNCIMWNDSPQEILGSVTATYSNIQGGWTGAGNIDEDPLFVGTGGYPFSLLEDSPCIDAGNPDPIYYDPEDPDNPGYALYPAMGTIINDMGAYGGPNAIGWPPVGLDDNVIVQIPEVFLQQNYPNPFNPTTTINYSLKEDSKVSLNIYNIKGQKVKQLVSDQLSMGQHSVIWDGKDDNGKSVSSGIYFYKLKTEDVNQTKRMLMLK